jgi:alkanesulfonate monooxygenase SsuD/methylene tetrahydromethanopterin reductase-like flavin-dependent oxidoreductase (luciferase family)
VDALRALWSSEETFGGKFNRFTRARSLPKPVQEGGVPIVVGGHTKAAARRAGRIGDGFFPARMENIDELIAECRRAAQEAGRDPDAIEITTGGVPNADSVKRLEDKGVSRIVIPPPDFDPSKIKPKLAEITEKLTAKV